MNYNLNYFINKFENTKDSLWCIDELHSKGRSCANGWCGVTGEWKDYGFVFNVTNESTALAQVFSVLTNGTNKDYDDRYSAVAACINNGLDERYQQSTPKQRILAALYDIKKMQNGQPAAPVEAEKPKPCADTIVGEFIPVTYKAMDLVSAN